MGEFRVERSTRVQAPPDAVRAHLVDFFRWQGWSPWEALDPQLQRTYSGPSSGVGATYAWTGNRKAGAGRMEVLRDTAEEVAVDLRFDKPFKAHNLTTFLLAPDGDGTRVTWRMTGPQTLAGRLFGLVVPMDKLVGKDFEKGLAALKDRAEGR